MNTSRVVSKPSLIPLRKSCRRELVRSILTSVVVATVEDLNGRPLDQIFA